MIGAILKLISNCREPASDKVKTKMELFRKPMIRDLSVSLGAAFLLLTVAYLMRSSFHGKPFWFLFLLGVFLGVGCIVFTSTAWLRKLQLLATSLFFGLALVEIGLIFTAWVHEGPSASYQKSDCALADWYDADTDLGYQPVPGMTARFSHHHLGQVNYNVVYHIDDYGQRLTRGNSEGDAVIFFGCSFTFGDGVEDEETLPSVVSRLTGYEYDVVNYGFSGWGPHQMLRILETKQEANRVRGKVKHVIYSIIGNHVSRCVGKTFWDFSGPKYQLTPQLDVEYQGPFLKSAISVLPLVMNRSRAGTFLLKTYSERYREKDADYELQRQILVKSANLLRERYDAPLSIMVWPIRDRERHQRLVKSLAAPVYEVIDTANYPGVEELRQCKIPHDNHPSAAAYEMLGPWLIERLSLEPTESTKDDGLDGAGGDSP